MQLLTAIGGGLFLVICVVGGLRLLLLAHRTRQLPERVLGLGLFLRGASECPRWEWPARPSNSLTTPAGS